MYNSVLVTKLVNSIMLDGKRALPRRLSTVPFDIIKEKTEKEPLEVFTQAMENIMPSLKSRPAVSAVPPIRSPWRCVLPVVRPWVCAG